MKDEKVLDLWAIQKYPNELYTALDNIKNDVIIFKNCICEFTIGKKRIKTRQFDTIIYSEESDTMIMLMRGGKATSEMAEKYLDEHGIDYHIVNLIELPDFKDDEKVKEFWFAREKYVVEDAVKDSVTKGQTTCKYDPDIKSKIIFKYRLIEGDAPLIKIHFRGLIEFDDKYVLPTKSFVQWNLHREDVLKVLEDNNIDVEIYDANNNLQI